MPTATQSNAGRRVRLSGPERREQILDVAKRIAGERGFHGLSIDAVARGAGITRPVVYEHFGDLRGLMEALITRESTRAAAQLMELLPQRGDEAQPEELMGGMMRAFLEAVRSDPVTWRLVLMPPEGTPPMLRERAERTRRAVTEQLARIAPRAMLAAGRSAPPDPELAALTMQAIAEDAARLLLQDPERYPIERLLAHTRWLLELFGFDREA
jgi:AcrR family transcriptional regulator